MNSFYGFFATIMSYILSPFVSLFNGNYAVAIFLFTVIINIVFLPVNMKQQRASAGQARLRYKLEKLKEECGDDRKRYQEEQARLMQESGSGMLSGCLPMLIRLPFFMGIYWAIREPLTYIVKIDGKVLESATKLLGEGSFVKGYEQTAIIQGFNNGSIKVKGLENIANYNFDFFGIDLTKSPEFSFNFSSVELILWIIPLLSFFTAFLSAVVTSRMQKRANPEMAQQGAGCMMIFMPLFSLYIAFIVPGAVGFYWACSNFVTMLIQVVMQKFYSTNYINARSEAKEMQKRRQSELARIREADASGAENE